MNLNHSTLHYTIIDSFLRTGLPPTASELESIFGKSHRTIVQALTDLQEYHGVVLQPDSNEVWKAHPFSATPTGFVVRAAGKQWWGNCAWCSLGVAALVGGTATIHTVPGDKTETAVIRIENTSLLDTDYCVHFPVRMSEAWKDVNYACSVMLVFEHESDVDNWCAQRGQARGDVRPIAQIWQLAREWYGRHADKDWAKWTADEASRMFERHGLEGPVWALGGGADRF